mmetsp:Transcript_13093/g.43382  ORF Transcript_13093/g.43382 Transcript_13093/m.43382 type:complete len:209 (+) Transcript_13093:1747-2373(+)
MSPLFVNTDAPSGPHLITTQSALHPGRRSSWNATVAGSRVTFPVKRAFESFPSFSSSDATSTEAPPPTAVPRSAPCPTSAASPRSTSAAASSRVAKITSQFDRIISSASARSTYCFESLEPLFLTNVNALGPGSKKIPAPFAFAIATALFTALGFSSSNTNPFTNTARVFPRLFAAWSSTPFTSASNGHGPRSYRLQNACPPSPSRRT